jgi:Ni2+-binding GTPase involved in maturation of urease and hydrogenase
MSNPARKLTVEKPVKLIFAGGFLGSGKTTALAALAKRLIERGKRVGFITNDQSENLVDTIIVRQMLTDLGVPVEEVVKGWLLQTQCNRKNYRPGAGFTRAGPLSYAQ